MMCHYDDDDVPMIIDVPSTARFADVLITAELMKMMRRLPMKAMMRPTPA